MKKYLKIFSVALAMLVMLTGCEGVFYRIEKDDSSDNKNSSDYESFSEYCDLLVTEWIEADALFAHYNVSDPTQYGVEFTEEDYNIGEINMDDMTADYAKMREELEIIKSFDDKDLTEQERITKECLVEYYETMLAYEGTDWLYNILSPTNGITSALSTNFIEYVFYDEEDVEQYLMFLKDIPNYMDSLYTFVRKQAEMGYFMPDYVADQTIESCEQYLDAETEPLLVTFEDKINTLDMSESAKEEYIALNEEYVNDYYLPVYEDVIDLLEELKGSGINDGGLAGFGNVGKQYYEAIIREKTSDNISPDELAEYLDDAMEQVINDMVAIYQEDKNAYNNAPYCTTDLKTPAEAMEFLLEHVEEKFPEPFTTEYVIEYQNPACEVDGVLAYYVNCRIDDVHYNSIKVNGSAVEENSIGMYLTIAHEGYPGHLYQLTGCYGNEDISNIRKLLNFVGVIEGWAEYASICSLDFLELSDTYKEMIYLDDVYSYIVCSRLDIGVNYEGWGMEDAKEFLNEYLYVDDEIVEELFYSAVSEPGMYLPYTYGQLRMWELRDMAEEELGSSFDEKEYHEFLTNLGIAPFDVIEEKLQIWLDEQQ